MSLQITDQTQFALALLNELGIKPTSANVAAIIGWENAEGGHWHNHAKYNPLNTTLAAPGAGNTGTQGNIKVYTSWDQGVKATADTLRNPAYSNVLAQLRSGSRTQIANAIGTSSWDGAPNAAYQGLVRNAINAVKILGAPLHSNDPFSPIRGKSTGQVLTGAANTIASPVTAAVDATESVGKFLGLLTNPATWLRILEFVAGLGIGFFALKQLAAAGSNA